MIYFLIIASAFCGWALLSLVGSERTKLIHELKSKPRPVTSPAPEKSSAAKSKPTAANTQATANPAAPAAAKPAAKPATPPAAKTDKKTYAAKK